MMVIFFNRMHLFRFNTISAAASGIRSLYSSSALGIEGFTGTKMKIKTQFNDIESQFKEKMTEFSQVDSANVVFTEDLKHMIHLADANDNDLNLVKQMMLKFSKQNKDMRFGSFVFGPVVMRMYHHLNKPTEALQVFRALEQDGFFDQLISFQILMDLLLENNLYQEVIDVFEIVKKKQIRGSSYPKNTVVLVLAACYKLNTLDSYNYAKKLWSDLTAGGHYPMRRAATFTAALAIQHNEPHVAVEVLTSVKQQSYVTVRNLKISALADLGRPDDAITLLRGSFNADTPNFKQHTFCEEVITKLRSAVEKLGKSELTEDFQKVLSHLQALKQISETTLDALLTTEISAIPFNEPTSKQFVGRRHSNYQQRPGIQEML